VTLESENRLHNLDLLRERAAKLALASHPDVANGAAPLTTFEYARLRTELAKVEEEIKSNLRWYWKSRGWEYGGSAT